MASKFPCCASMSNELERERSIAMIGDPKLGRASASFALAAAVTVLFNTVLAWAKDAYHPLNDFMGSIAGHNWTTQGLADIILFFALGLAFMKIGWAEKIAPQRLIFLLAASVAVAAIGLFAWYALF
jgi:hypothetical protein